MRKDTSLCDKSEEELGCREDCQSSGEIRKFPFECIYLLNEG